MFKFARYFFIGFLITTIMPLILMFILIHHQMASVMQNNMSNIIDMSTKELENTTNQYLKIQEGEILEKFNNISLKAISLKQLQKIFKPSKVELLPSNNENKVVSYYDVIKDANQGKPSLYSVSILPVRNSKQNGLKITNKVNIKKLQPRGPFNLKIYYGDKIEENSYNETVSDKFLSENIKLPFAPKAFPPRKFPDKQMDIKLKNNAFKLKNNDGKVVANLVVLPALPPFRMGLLNPIDNIFGIVILLAGITLSFIMGIYIYDKLVKPLISISDALKKVQEGALSTELSEDSKQTHILDIYNNFNKMVQNLKDREKLRKSFISNLTHDLKTPLIAQEKSLGFIATKFEQLNMQNESELAKSLERNNQHLLRMVNLIVESYSFEEDNIILKLIPINLSKLFDDCNEELMPLILEKNIQLINNIPNEFPSITADLTSFKRIFLNLISNAVENIPKNSYIRTNAEIEGDVVKIYIEDNGNGISEEDLKLIFDRYFTGKSLERKLGAGLGLDICRKLVELHHGEIRAESKLNEYTKFTITLPLNS